MTPTALQTALDQCAKDGHPLYETVIALGCVEERIAVLAPGEGGGTGVRRQRRGRSRIHWRFVWCPQRVARLHELVPVAVDDKTIRFLTATPYDVDAERDVSFATGRTPVVTLACRSTVQAALTRFYPDGRCVRRVTEPQPAPAQAAATTEPVPSASSASPDTVIVTLCHSLLARTVEAHASDLFLDPASGGGLLAQMRVAGVLETATTVPHGPRRGGDQSLQGARDESARRSAIDRRKAPSRFRSPAGGWTFDCRPCRRRRGRSSYCASLTRSARCPRSTRSAIRRRYADPTDARTRAAERSRAGHRARRPAARRRRSTPRCSIFRSERLEHHHGGGPCRVHAARHQSDLGQRPNRIDPHQRLPDPR